MGITARAITVAVIAMRGAATFAALLIRFCPAALRLGSMTTQMFAATEHFQIRRVVVFPVAIQMVNIFPRCQFASEYLFHHGAMGLHRSSLLVSDMIVAWGGAGAFMNGGTTTLPRAIAFLPLLTRANHKLLAALVAYGHNAAQAQLRGTRNRATDTANCGGERHTEGRAAYRAFLVTGTGCGLARHRAEMPRRAGGDINVRAAMLAGLVLATLGGVFASARAVICWVQLRGTTVERLPAMGAGDRLTRQDLTLLLGLVTAIPRVSSDLTPWFHHALIIPNSL